MRALVLACAALAACKSSASNVVATLEEAVATVDRMPRADAAWQPARRGDTFVIGSAVRTGADSHARLKLGASGKLDVRPSSVVYFKRTPGRARDDVKVETGGVEIEAGDDSVGLGEAVLEAHGRARVDSSAAGTTIVVNFGRVVLEDNVIGAGQSITLSTAGTVAAAPPKPREVAATVATTTERKVAIIGKPARATSPSGESELAIGDHPIAPGTTIVTPAGGSAVVTHDGASGSTEGPSEVRVADGSLLAIASGTVALQGTTGDAVAAIPGGTVTARAGAAAGIAVDHGEAQVTAQRGEVAIETATGTTQLAPGESVTVSAAGGIARMPAPPANTVVTIDAGESPTVHDGKAPTPIRVRFGATCTSGVVEVAKDRTFKRVVARSGGSEAANVLVPAGTFAYRVRCSAGKSTSGSLTVARDSGRNPLPKVAASTAIDLDGREYTVLYQNLLPALTLSWRNAPKGFTYTFVLKSSSGEKRLTSLMPSISLESGALHEGTYTAWGEIGGARRSDTSRVVIDFDNAAPSASIDGIDVDGTTVHVRGTVIDGTTVSVDGGVVELDRHRRFATDLVAKEHEVGSAVRIAHPKTGIDYYVVRTP